MTTLKDVARVAGVSRQTVSNVINDPARVRPETRARVQQAIADLGYRPHRPARSLQARASHLFGYRIPPGSADVVSPVLDRFLHALTDAARDEGYHILLFTPGLGQDEVDVHEDLVATGTVDGFVLAETNYGDERVGRLATAGIPFVCFGRTGVDVPHDWVDVDGAAGTRQAVEHLVARGHERIAFVGWPAGSFSGDERSRGWREGLKSAGLPVDQRLDVRGPNEVETGYGAFRAWRDSGLDVTGAVCASDTIALGVVRAARAGGEEVGRGFGVVGFDDTGVAPLVDPPLTSLRQPLEEVAIRLVKVLVARVKGDNGLPAGVLLAPELVVRESA